MGLFSLFKKGKPDAAPDGDDDAARLAANSEALRSSHANSQLQRDIARATTLKIDAIEAAMEADIFNTPEPARGSRPAPRATAGGGAAQGATAGAADAAGDASPATLPLLDGPTTELLADDDIPAPLAADETAPVVEESAILHANGQSAIAGHMLAAALADAAASGAGARQDRTVWWLLFDLYQVQGQRDAFDSLSLDYASTFETSPPAWRGNETAGATAAAAPHGQAPAAGSGTSPTQAFGAVLDAGAAPIVERLRAQDPGAPLRLDFSRIAAVDAAGCALLLDALRGLRGRDLIVAAAAELAALLQAGLAPGRRGDGEAPWLLLLELLQLLGREQDFEEASMDYCITFEVSPPPYTPPHKVATAARQADGDAAALRAPPVAPSQSDRFLLPPVVEGDCGALLEAIGAYAGQHAALVFDCSRLLRIDFGAANLLLARLQTLAVEGRRVELRDVNHLVAALLRLLGYGAVAHIFAHKY